MPHTARDVAALALRKLGVLRAGAEPKAADAAEALASLSSFYEECITSGAFGRVANIPVTIGGDATSGVNQHINVLTEDEVNIDLPTVVPYYHWDTWMRCRDYGWGLNVPLGPDNGDNVPPDKSVVRVTDQFGTGRATYIYDSPIQRWVRIDALTLNDEPPLSARSLDGLASVIAVRLADQFGSQLSATTVQSANRYQSALVHNYGMGHECYS